jgi:diguanylate cyclase (GGDEF)-like protein/PAS domain S-box-containing protein
MSAEGANGRRARSRPSRGAPSEPFRNPGIPQRVTAILYTAEPGDEGRWTYVSPQIETILGFTEQEWCSDPMLWNRQLHPDDRDWVLNCEESGDHGDGATEYRMLHRDGHTVWLRDDALLLTDDDGKLYWRGVLSDITDRKRTEAELERAAAQHAAVARLGEHALKGVSGADLAREALAVAVDLVGVEFGGVLELDHERNHFDFLAAHGLPEAAVEGGLAFDLDTQAGYAITHGQMIISDWATETRCRPTEPVRHSAARSGMSVLIESRSGAFGVFGVHSIHAREYSRIDVDFVQTLANVLGDAFERQRTEDHIRHRALHDPLTGLPNRILFMDRLGQGLSRMRRRDSRAAILVLDLDRFKLVNESLGHEVGDELLAAVALRVAQTVRASDTVARFGADEFGILLEEILGEHDAVDMAQRIAGEFTRPFVLGGNEHFVTTSIGIALAFGGERPEDVIRDADAAMHRAKERGRARYELFDERLRGQAISRLRVENDLRRALERDELTLDYQPIITLPDREIAGVEALLRWDHPTRGRVPPLEFIPIAEENGLIEPIGRWVLERACRQAADWYAQRPDARPISVAVNLSALQFENASLPETVAATLRASGLDPGLLALEITESVMMGRGKEIADALSALKQIGVRLILDDFGTGYSSLAYLSRLPLDVLKVDRSFVSGLGRDGRDTAITEAIVAMSHALSLRVVGEGAETETQTSELARLGCDLVQGFHFSRPVPAPAITKMLLCGPSWATPAGPPVIAGSAQRRRSRLQR